MGKEERENKIRNELAAFGSQTNVKNEKEGRDRS